MAEKKTQNSEGRKVEAGKQLAGKNLLEKSSGKEQAGKNLLEKSSGKEVC
jgi:hypothetical protein